MKMNMQVIIIDGWTDHAFPIFRAALRNRLPATHTHANQLPGSNVLVSISFLGSWSIPMRQDWRVRITDSPLEAISIKIESIHLNSLYKHALIRLKLPFDVSFSFVMYQSTNQRASQNKIGPRRDPIYSIDRQKHKQTTKGLYCTCFNSQIESSCSFILWTQSENTNIEILPLFRKRNKKGSKLVETIRLEHAMNINQNNLVQCHCNVIPSHATLIQN